MPPAYAIAAVTPCLLDELFELRFPWAKDRKLDFDSVTRWSGELPIEIEQTLFDLTWPSLRKLTTVGLQSHPDLVESCLDMLPTPSDLNFLTRGVALVMLLDQCPRMFHTRSTNVRWVSSFFDPLAQGVTWHLLDYGRILDYEAWSARGYDFESYLVITSLVMSAADHSESSGRHNVLHEMTRQRRTTIERVTGRKDPFAKELELDGKDPLAFSRWMRSGPSNLKDVYEFAYLRLAIIDIHYPIIQRFGRYPWRNGGMGRVSTEQELHFLEQLGHFGEPEKDIQEQIFEDIAAERWTPFW